MEKNLSRDLEVSRALFWAKIRNQITGVLKPKKRKRKKEKPVFCVDCKFHKRRNPGKGISTLIYTEKDDSYERVTQGGLRHGCAYHIQRVVDFVTKHCDKVIGNCEDRNRFGKCKAYKRKLWKVWV